MLLTDLKNGFEIATLATFFYYFSLWLKKDKEKNLVWYFYSYYFLFLGSWYLHFNVLNYFMLYTSPLICMLLVIVHQDILQRNFISIKKDAPASKSQEYLEQLLRTALSTLNRNKNFTCILEHQYDLKPFITSDFYLKADLTQECLSYLIESPHFDENKYLWCNTQGYIVALNTQWKIHQTQTLAEIPYSETQWKEDAILITSKTDAAVIKGNPTTRLFDLVIKGQVHEKLSAHHLLQLLKMQIVQLPLLGEKTYEQSHKRIVGQQQNS